MDYLEDVVETDRLNRKAVRFATIICLVQYPIAVILLHNVAIYRDHQIWMRAITIITAGVYIHNLIGLTKQAYVLIDARRRYKKAIKRYNKARIKMNEFKICKN